MRRLVFGLAVVLGLTASASTGRAQGVNGGFSDPFFLYYGFYLPRQAAMAAQPGPEMMINNQAANQQLRAMTDRGGLFDPLGGGLGDDDPMRPFGPDRGRLGTKRGAMLSPNGITTTNINGAGPQGYYNRTMRYYPSLRTGRSQARAFAPSGRGGRAQMQGLGGGPGVPGGGGMGMGGMGGMNPMGGMR